MIIDQHRWDAKCNKRTDHRNSSLSDQGFDSKCFNIFRDFYYIDFRD